MEANPVDESKPWTVPDGSSAKVGSARPVEQGTAHKDADTPDELTRWIWDKYVGVPVAHPEWEQEYENLLDRVRRMDRSSFTKGLHEGANQMKGLSNTVRAAAVSAPPSEPREIVHLDCKKCGYYFEGWANPPKTCPNDGTKLVRVTPVSAPEPEARRTSENKEKKL